MQSWQNVKDAALARLGRLEHPEVERVIDRVRLDQLSLLTSRVLHELVHDVGVTEMLGPDGAIVDVGAGLAGTSVIMCAAKRFDRPMWCLDRFGLADDGTDLIDFRDHVEDTFKRLGYPVEDYKVRLVRGEPAYTAAGTDTGPVALAHVAHLISSVELLAGLAPRVVPGGRIVVDAATWTAKKSVDMTVQSFVDQHAGWRIERHAGWHLVRL